MDDMGWEPAHSAKHRCFCPSAPPLCRIALPDDTHKMPWISSFRELPGEEKRKVIGREEVAEALEATRPWGRVVRHRGGTVPAGVEVKGQEGSVTPPKDEALLRRRVMFSGLVTAIGIALHNLPEGVAVLLASLKSSQVRPGKKQRRQSIAAMHLCPVNLATSRVYDMIPGLPLLASSKVGHRWHPKPPERSIPDPPCLGCFDLCLPGGAQCCSGHCPAQRARGGGGGAPSVLRHKVKMEGPALRHCRGPGRAACCAAIWGSISAGGFRQGKALHRLNLRLLPLFHGCPPSCAAAVGGPTQRS